jgi:hypothetical protein
MTSRHAFLALLALASCAEPSNATVKKCVDECDSSSDCPGGTGDCLDVCESEYANAEQVQCVPEYTAIVDCLAKETAACDPSACSIELSTYTICFGEYCGSDRSTFQGCLGAGGCTPQKDPICPAPPTGSGGGGVGGGSF